MLAFKSTLRWWHATGGEGFFQGTIRLMEQGDESIKIQYGDGSSALVFPKTSNWTFSSYKLKSTNARARVVVLLLENNTRIQLTMGISDKFTGKAVVLFFERAATATIN